MCPCKPPSCRFATRCLWSVEVAANHTLHQTALELKLDRRHCQAWKREQREKAQKMAEDSYSESSWKLCMKMLPCFQTQPHVSIPLVILPVLVTKCIGCSRISTMGSLHTSCFMKVAALLCLTVREEECPAASPRNVSAKRRLTRRNRPLHVAACRPEWVSQSQMASVCGQLGALLNQIPSQWILLYTWYPSKSVPNLSRSICFYMQAKVWQDHTQQDKLQTWQQRDPEGASSRDTAAKARKCCTRPTRIEQSQHKHAAYCSIIIHTDLWHYTVDLKRLTVRALDLDDHNNSIKEKLTLVCLLAQHPHGILLQYFDPHIVFAFTCFSWTLSP